VSQEQKLDLLQAGKLSAEQLRELLTPLQRVDPRVIIGPQLGEDATVLDFGSKYLVVTTDPVTFATDRIGWYVVHVNANDIAVMGATPRWFFTTLLLPEQGTTFAMVDSIMTEIRQTCDEFGISVSGGHTEITTGLQRPIIVGQMIGEVDKKDLIRKTSLQVGDKILLTQGLAIEGTALLAREKRELLQSHLSAEQIDQAEQFLFNPGISVVKAARIATSSGDIHSMHDPTEGGLVAGLHELAVASGKGLRVFADRVPIFPETHAICRCLQIDPLRLIASGALLIGASAQTVEKVAAALKREGIPVGEIAEVVPANDGMQIESGGATLPLIPPDRDEIAKVFES
jgi:hydrogenase maturation factor